MNNIFPLKKYVLKKNPEKITIDFREKNCLIASELKSRGFEIEFKELKVGDYLVKGIIIERKTITDFVSSMINQRMSNQIQELKQYKKKIIIIEGYDEQELYNDINSGSVNPNSIRGFLISITLNHQIPLIFSKNYKDTARYIEIILKRQSKEKALNPIKKTLNKKQQMQYIIESFQGIGPKTAKKLLKKYDSIQNILNTSKKDLKKIIGKKANSFDIIKEKY